MLKLKQYMECKKEENLQFCNCTYLCEKKGRCCDCLKYHREKKELPACYFTTEQEKTYDRTVEFYLKNN